MQTTSRIPLPPVDRHTGILDTALVSTRSLVQIGAGRSIGITRQMCGAGVRRFSLIDPGFIDRDNVGQSEHGLSHVGLSKPDAAEMILRDIAPDVTTDKFHCRAAEIDDLDDLMRRHALVIIGVDDPVAMFELADQAQRVGTDAIVVGTQGDNRQFFVAGIFMDGPTLKELLPEISEGLASGDMAPAFFPSCLMHACTMNNAAARAALGVLHFRGGSLLPIADDGRALVAHPLIIGLNGIHEPSRSMMPMRLLG